MKLELGSDLPKNTHKITLYYTKPWWMPRRVVKYFHSYLYKVRFYKDDARYLAYNVKLYAFFTTRNKK